MVPATADGAHRTNGPSAKPGNFGPVQPVHCMPIRRGVAHSRYSVLGRRGRAIGARPSQQPLGYRRRNAFVSSLCRASGGLAGSAP